MKVSTADQEGHPKALGRGTTPTPERLIRLSQLYDYQTGRAKVSTMWS
ncbi:MAG: hypothetical protein ACRD0L_07495 [Acidimicrobiales bacterium]